LRNESKQRDLFKIVFCIPLPAENDTNQSEICEIIMGLPRQKIGEIFHVSMGFESLDMNKNFRSFCLGYSESHLYPVRNIGEFSYK
jgi:hypothetical protein